MKHNKKIANVAIITTGCAVNQAYSEIMRGLLKAAGYTIVQDVNEADVIILNACAIKKPTEDRMISLAKKLSMSGKKLIIAGCLAEVSHDRIQRTIPTASLVGPYNLFKIQDLIPQVLEGKRVVLMEKEDFTPLGKTRELFNKFIAVVPIARGCLGHCAYCVDKRIWGDLKSYPKEQIVEEVKALVEKGVREIRLSAQDTGPYGWDLGYTLVDLLKEIIEIPGDFRIRIGMMSPDTAMKIIDDLLEIMKTTSKIYKYLHIPVQSGSNRILRKMNRKYTVEEFIDLVETIRRKLGPDTTIATDIITGFPGETEEDHRASIELLETTKPDIINLSRYGDRPGVPSSKLYPKIHSKILKRRSRELAEVIRRISYERNQPYVNKAYEALLLEKDGANLIGRLFNYKLIVVKGKGNEDLLGKFVKVRINDATWKTLYGEVL
ncbi:MAG: tRNA (N(6)-L-threonylcarbamoyladenosine(37)-C(2))-methylthiotransferase [Candidatus Njordarchaeales archaeon]